MNKIFSSLQTKLFFFCFILSLFLSLFLSWQIYQLIKNSFEKEQAQALHYNLNLATESVERDLETLYQTVLFCSTNTYISKFMDDRNWKSYTSYPLSMSAYEQLRIKIFGSPIENFINKIILYSYNGDYIIQGKKYGLSTDIQNCIGQDFFVDLLYAPGYEWIGLKQEPFFSSNTETLSLPVIRPIVNSSSGQNSGWVYIALNTSLVSQKINSEKSSFYWLINNIPYIYTQNGFQPCSLELEYLSDNKAMVHNEGESRLSVYTTLNNAPWTFIQTLPETGRFFQQSPIHSHLLPYIAVLFISCLLFSLVLKKIVSDPIKRICGHLDRIASGDFSTDLSLETADEFGYIGKSINTMAQNIARLMRQKLETEEEKRRLELDNLQNQISPHFLYNTLYTIKWMSIIQNTPSITEMLDSLTQIMKTISKNTDSKTSVRDELNLLHNYITILKYRYGDTFSYQESIENESLLNCSIFKFSLQPIIENAVFHGLSRKPEPGIISLDIQQDNFDLIIRISDNGVGISNEQTAAILDDISTGNKEEGLFKKIGLKNINRRMKLEYGDSYGLQIYSKPGKYTQIIVRYPLADFHDVSNCH